MASRIETAVVVIGGGPAGYVCAIRSSQLGVKTVLVEKASMGGVCLNVGCIPSKALISASKRFTQVSESAEMGIQVSDVKLDLEKMLSWKEGIVGKLTSGVGHLLKENGAEIVSGAAKFTGPNGLVVHRESGKDVEIVFKHAVIAVGSVPTELAGFEVNGQEVLSSSHALALKEIPQRMTVIGGGYIGMELGGVWQRLGSQVTVVEYADRILPGFEKDLVRPVERQFKSLGGKVMPATRAVSWKKKKTGLSVKVENRKNGNTKSLDADVILLTVGRRPRSEDLGLEKVGIIPNEHGFIEVDGEQRTQVPHVFAVGDVAGEPMLAHKGSKEGEVAAEVIAGHAGAFDVKAVPAVVFTDPEIATVGMTKNEAEKAGYQPRVGRFSFAANGRALSLNESEGFVRLVVDKETEVVLGGQVVGPEASNLIAEIGLAIEMGALASDLGLTIHAHPTLAETVMEAANATLGHAIHAMNR